jgi:hypothetical protein
MWKLRDMQPVDLPLLVFNERRDADALTLRSSSCSVVLSIGQPQEALCWDYLSAMGGLCLSASLNSRRQPADRTYVRIADRDADGHDPNWIWRPRAVPAGLGQAADYSHTFSQIPLIDMPSYVTLPRQTHPLRISGSTQRVTRDTQRRRTAARKSSVQLSRHATC